MNTQQTVGRVSRRLDKPHPNSKWNTYCFQCGEFIFYYRLNRCKHCGSECVQHFEYDDLKVFERHNVGQMWMFL